MCRPVRAHRLCLYTLRAHIGSRELRELVQVVVSWSRDLGLVLLRGRFCVALLVPHKPWRLPRLEVCQIVASAYRAIQQFGVSVTQSSRFRL